MGNARIEAVGNVGKVKDLHFTQSGKAVCDLSIAVTPSRRENDEWVDLPTMWFTVVFWGKQAEAVTENVKVGDRLVITGTLHMEEYVTKDGRSGTEYRITADSWGIVPKPIKPVGASVTDPNEDPWAA